MPRKPQPKPQSEVTQEVPQVAPIETLEVAPAAPSVEAPKATPGPVINLIGEGADKVKFTINPKAARYDVHSTGMVVEHL